MSYLTQLTKYYGVTKNPLKGGFLLPNGWFLDFSEGSNERSQDHRNIVWVSRVPEKDRESRWDVINPALKDGALWMGRTRTRMLLDTSPNNLYDRPDYFGPGCDVASTDMVGVSRKSAPGADERCLGTTVRLIDTSAFGACSASIARVHGNKRDTRKCSLVCKKRSQLEERPGMQDAPLSLSYSYPVADAREILDGDTAPGVFGFADYFLANDVVCMGMEVLLPPSKLAKMSFGALGSSTLEPSAEFGDTTTRRQYGLTRMRFAVRVHCKIANSKVNTKPTFRLNGRSIWKIDGYEQEEVTLPIDQICLSSCAIKASLMVGADSARDNYSTIEREQTHTIEPIFEAEKPLVKRDSTVFSEHDKLRSISTVGFANLRDCSYGVLSRQPKDRAHVLVIELLQAYFVSTFQLKGPMCQPGTRIIDSSQCRQKPRFLVGIYEQLDGCNQLHEHRHNTSIETINIKSEQRFLPALKDGASALETR